MLQKSLFIFPKTFFHKSIILLLIVYTASILLSGEAPVAEIGDNILWVRSLKQYLHVLVSIALVLLIPYFIRTTKDVVSTAKILILGFVPAAFCVAAIEVFRSYDLQFADFIYNLIHDLHFNVNAGDFFQPLFATAGDFSSFRITLFASEPTLAAMQLALLWPFAYAIYLDKKSGVKKWGVVFLIISIALLILTFSATGILVFTIQLVALLAILASTGSRRHNIRFALLITVIISAVSFFSLNTGVLSRLISFTEDFELRDKSAMIRILGQNLGVNTFLSSPMFGVGVGNYVFYMNDMLPSWAEDLLLIPQEGLSDLSIQNMYILIASDTGIIGVSIFICILSCLIYKTYRSLLRSGSNEMYPYILASTISLVGLVVGMLFQGSFVYKSWFFFLGFSIAIYYISVSCSKSCVTMNNSSGKN